MEIINEQKFTTQVDVACEDTSDCKIPVIVKLTKDLRGISKLQRCDICGKFYHFKNTLQ